MVHRNIRVFRLSSISAEWFDPDPDPDRPFRTGKEPVGFDAPLKPLSDKTNDGTSPCRISTFRIFSGFNTPEEIGRHLYIPIEALFCAELDKVSGCRAKN